MHVTMIRNIILAAVMLFVDLTSAAGTRSGIDGLISDFKAETKCRDVSVVVFDHGETTYYGDSEALYQIGSMTKAFTGLAVQKLIDEGLISGQDKVSDLIPGFKAYYMSSEADITVDDLMTQRSGYTNSETDYPSADENMTLAEWAESISGRELASMPGTEYAYSNVNYDLLGLIIENVTGTSYRDAMTELVLEPFGLDSTYAGIPESRESIVTGTRLGFRTVFDYEIPVREGSIPAGYFYSDTSDIGRWMEAWIGGTDPDMEQVFSRLENEGDYYAGWEMFEGGVTGHSGGTPNYSSRIVFSRSSQTGVCVLTNLNVAATTDSLCDSIFSMVSGQGKSGSICDVWTVFDIIFTVVSVLGAAGLIFAFMTRKKVLLIVTGSVLALITALIFILFPVIFGAGIKAIALTWAPWSFLAGICLLIADVLCIGMKIVLVRINEGRA